MRYIRESSRRQKELRPHCRGGDIIGRVPKHRSDSGRQSRHLESFTDGLIHIAPRVMKNTDRVRG
jgi:hypothetical protein